MRRGEALSARLYHIKRVWGGYSLVKLMTIAFNATYAILFSETRSDPRMTVLGVSKISSEMIG